MSLTSRLRAMLTYANEKTEAGDTTIGAAIKTLCDGYSGASGSSTFPTITDADTLSSRIRALTAYADETTGVADATLAEAIKRLCDGYNTTPQWMIDAAETYGITIDNLKDAQSQSDYTFLSYIYGDDTHYIDSGYIPTSTTGFMLAAANFVATGSDINFIGCRIDKGARFILNIYQYKYLAYGYNAFVSTKLQNINMTTDYINMMTLNYKNERLVRCNDTSVNITETFANISRSIHIGRQNSEIATTGSVNYDIHMFTITEDTDCKQFLLPCVRNSDGVAGMYDIISKQFLANPQGTGFTHGDEMTLEGKFAELSA